MTDLPANSHSAKEKASTEKVVKKVVTGSVVEKKPPFWSRIREVFGGGDLKTAGSYIAAEVLLPAARQMIYDAISRGTERMVFGDRGHSRPVEPGRPRVQYNNPNSRYSPVQYGSITNPGPSYHQRNTSNNVNSIVLDTRGEASAIVEQLGDIMERYEVASVADFRTMIGEPSDPTDQGWGWATIIDFEIRQDRDGGWALHIPRPIPI